LQDSVGEKDNGDVTVRAVRKTVAKDNSAIY
jgi:hypothetical protein